MKKLTLILMALAAIFVFAGWGDSPKDVTLKWYKAISDGDVEKANKYSTPDSGAANNYIIYESQGLRNSLVEEISEVKDWEEKIHGDKAFVGETKLKKIDGKWKVNARVWVDDP